MNPEEKVKITYLTVVHGANVLANFGCYVAKDDLYMSKLSLIKTKDGGVFIGWPSEQFIDPKTGQKARSNFCWYGKIKNTEFQEDCKASIKAYCLKKGIRFEVPIESATQKAIDPVPSVSNEYYVPNEECPF